MSAMSEIDRLCSEADSIGRKLAILGQAAESGEMPDTVYDEVRTDYWEEAAKLLFELVAELRKGSSSRSVQHGGAPGPAEPQQRQTTTSYTSIALGIQGTNPRTPTTLGKRPWANTRSASPTISASRSARART